jgi:TonB-linked SusC/RagA family outer membrane protein
MKLTVFLLLCSILQVGARGFAQQITLSERSVSPDKIFSRIEQQTGYKFVYTETFLKNSRPVTIHLKNASLDDVLDICLKDLPYTWSVLNKLVVIKDKPAETGPPPPPLQDITGKIFDEKGNAIAGATIAVKGTRQNAVSETDGGFALKGLKEDAVLVISFTGYQTKEIAIKGKHELTVRMEISVRSLNEIVVVAYGTIRKRDLTGSVSQVKPAEITSYPANNVINALQGRAAGVQVQQNNGAPGGSISVRIRGTNSILGGNEPLYVVDGFPYPNNPTFIQPGDIESVEILKDASSIALYGSRGANGVILITTRNGHKTGKTQVDFTSAYTVQSPMKKIKLMNAGEYAQFYNLQAATDNLSPYFTQSQIDSLSKGPSTDWQDLVLHDAPMYTNNITVSGGDERTQYSLSGGVFAQNGIIRNSNFNRYTLRGNLNHTISKIFAVSYSIYLTRSEGRNQNSGGSNRGADLISGMLDAPPTLSPYLPDGSYRRLNTAYPFISNTIVNPLVTLNKTTDRFKADNVFSNAALTIKPIKDLSIRISGGIQNNNNRADTYTAIEPSINSVGSALVGTKQLTSLLNENVATYTKNMGEHHLSVTAGYTFQNYVETTLNGSGTGFLSDISQTGNLSAATTPGIPASSYQKWVLLSLIGRLNYSYGDKYFATMSFRRDGSSRYAPDNKWSNFPSAALAWRVYNEKFLKDAKWLSDLKLRVSYGATGSTAIDPYATLNQLSSGNTIFGDALAITYAPGTTLPGNLKWETTNQFDAGLDAAFLGGRLRLTADVYLKKTNNLLNRVQLPVSMGYLTTLRNVGQVENKGLELAAEADVFKGEVNWTIGANISFNRNKVLKLYQGQDIFGTTLFTGNLNDNVNILREGKPMGLFYGYKEAGYTATGDIRYADLNKDGKISADDKTFLGNPNPSFIYGFNSVLSYKGFELTVFILGKQGNDIFNISKSATLDLGMGLNVPREEFYDHWTPTNTTAKYPRISRSISGNMSSRFVENGSFLRFRNIQLAYNLPVKKWAPEWWRSAQLYVSGQNLITITKYSWYDPDVNTYGSANSITSGIDNYTYPNYKSLTVGLRCGF